MASLNKRPEYYAELPRDAHDIGRKLHFTSSTGMMLPVYHHPLNPSEKIKLSANLFTRCNYLSTPALSEIDFKLDFFFVPMTMLCNFFQNWFYGTDDFVSSTILEKLTLSDYENLPLLNLDDALGQYVDVNGISQQWIEAFNHYRLAMHLGYNPNGIFNKFGSNVIPVPAGKTPTYYSVDNPQVFPYAALAYQACYYKYYRLQDYEANDIEAYNVDSSLNLANIKASAYDKILRLHNIPRYKDYFTSVKNAPVASVTSGLVLSGSSVFDYLTKVNSYLYNNAVGASTASGQAGVSQLDVTQVRGFNVSQIFSSQQFRTIFAVEKLLRIYGRADKTYDAQILAHFGWKVPHDPLHQLTFLGSFDGGLDIQEVSSTADTATAALGALAGKGYGGLKGREINFTAPCHGVLIGIYYSRPKISYEMCGFDKVNVLNKRVDFYQPEFDKLGMQPLYGYEADFDFIGTSKFEGYQYRYEQFKRKYDCHTVAFADPTFPSASQHLVNAWNSWLVGRRPNQFTTANLKIASSYAFNQSDLYVTPFDLNGIMTIQYSNTYSASFFQSPWLMFQTDPFINWLEVKCNLVSPMSKFGEPELD